MSDGARVPDDTQVSDHTEVRTGAAATHGRRWPLAGLGYLYATAVGFAWGFIWSTGRVRRVSGLWVFTGMPRWAFGRGGSCVGGCYLTDHNVSAAVLRHELVHQQQWRHYGMALPLLYLIAGRNPLRNRFEIEAGLEDGGYVRRSTHARTRSPG